VTAIRSNGITIEYEEQGAGEPLLMVMGLGAQLIDWPQDFVDMVAAKGFRVIRIDNRDAGLSTEFTAEPPSVFRLVLAGTMGIAPPAEYRIGDMAADVVGVLDALGIESAHVVGQSMGGMIVQAMAIEHPQRVRSMTSIMSTTGQLRYGRPKLSVLRKASFMADGSVPTPEQGMEMLRLISGPEFDEQEARAMGEASMARSFRPKGMGRQTAAIMASPDRTEGLRRVAAPTLVVHGMVDPLVRPSGGIATARAVPSSRLLMFNDMGHWIPRTRRQEIADAIAENAARANPMPVS
jgi:pimeloyl-ACP methyl ester carboxylesterase